ncbi:MAG: prolipoprotein diacylglyceryl transferase [Clostridia bacterium]|nr:prolipoprotein diacylglyceryl transferase [Clostridia bacterium]
MDKIQVFFEGLGLSFNISPVAFGSVMKYGLIIAVGYAIAVVMGGMRAYKWRMSIDHMLDIAIWGTIAGIIGARLYYVFSLWDYYKDHIGDIFKIWQGGLAIYGGIIAALIAALIVCLVTKLSITNLLDLCGMSFLLAQGIGRWGNFFNQEAFGTNTTTALFRMYSEKTRDYLLSVQDELAAKGVTVYPDQPVHPTFLYESVLCIVGFFICRIICNKYRKFRGEIFAFYLVWYGAVRFIIEGMRTDSLYIGHTNIRVSQVVSLVMVVGGIVWLILGFIYAKKHPLHQEIRHKIKKGEKIDWKNTAPHEPGFDKNGKWVREGYIDPAYSGKVARAGKAKAKDEEPEAEEKEKETKKTEKEEKTEENATVAENTTEKEIETTEITQETEKENDNH